MKYAEKYMFLGIFVGAVLRASIRELIEVATAPMILGLAFSTIVMGMAMGWMLKGYVNEQSK